LRGAYTCEVLGGRSLGARGGFSDGGLGAHTLRGRGLVFLAGWSEHVDEPVPLADSLGGDRLIVVILFSVRVVLMGGTLRGWTRQG
jgi:hypothetical protein